MPKESMPVVGRGMRNVQRQTLGQQVRSASMAIVLAAFQLNGFYPKCGLLHGFGF